MTKSNKAINYVGFLDLVKTRFNKFFCKYTLQTHSKGSESENGVSRPDKLRKNESHSGGSDV